jgi:D-glycerate 3-kinase
MHQAFTLRSDPSKRRSLTTLVPGLLERINTGYKSVIGIAGAPGSGKSTLARVLVQSLNHMEIPACLLSLDDYYLSRAQREVLSKEVHLLFRQRGVPGTHEFDRLLSDLDQIQEGGFRSLRLPVFDKSIDDRIHRHAWRSLEADPLLTVLEGWFIGVPPQQEAQLFHPVNELERKRDSDGSWRQAVHDAWLSNYAALRSRLDQVWYIRVPDWNCVIDWRWQQEQELAQMNLKSRAEVENFLGSFERIVNHMQDSYPQWADLVMEADRNHHISLSQQSRKAT